MMTSIRSPLVSIVSLVLAVASPGCSSDDDPAASASTDAGGSRATPVATAPKTPVAEDETANATLAIDAGAGAVHYDRLCALCHGKEGRGDTPMAKMLNPPPRGFVDEPWRFIEASTPEQELAGVQRVIREGLPDSGMPGYAGQLSSEQVAQVAAYVMAFRQEMD